MASAIEQQTHALGPGRSVRLRPHTTDQAVWSDTFVGLYHVPPETMPVPLRVLDVGANIGLTAAHYAAMWPEADIVAVEMDALNAEWAEQNFAGRVIWAACAGDDGFRTYSSLDGEWAYRIQEGGDVQVPSRRLRTLIDSAFGPEAVCDFVKLDIEGAERAVFEDAHDWAPRVRFVLAELHKEMNGLEVDDAIALLQESGFAVERFEKHPQAVFARRSPE